MVFVIIGALVAIIGLNVNKAVQSQKFQAEVSRVVETLRLAESLMLLFDDDVYVVFEEDKSGKGIQIRLETHCPESQKKIKALLPAAKKFSLIHTVAFEEPEPTQQEKGRLALQFYSAGTKMSKGVLHLSTGAEGDKEGVLERYIELPGFPAPIRASYQNPVSKKESTEKDAENTELTHWLMHETAAATSGAHDQSS